MQVVSMILSVLLYGIMLFGVGYGMYCLIKHIKHKKKKKKGDEVDEYLD